MGVRKGGSMGSNDPPPLSEVTFTIGIFFFKSRSTLRTLSTIALIRSTGNDGKMQLTNFASRHNYYARKKGRRKKKAAAMCQDTTRYTKKAKQAGVVGDESLTSPVVAGRLDETTRQAQQMIALA